MKKFLTTIFTLASIACYSQNTTDSSLYLKTKIELTDIYLEEVNRVVNKIPLITFDTIAGNVPETTYTKKKFSSVNSVQIKYNEKIIDSYNVIIPYADKAKIIEAIKYLQSIK